MQMLTLRQFSDFLLGEYTMYVVSVALEAMKVLRVYGFT